MTPIEHYDSILERAREIARDEGFRNDSTVIERIEYLQRVDHHANKILALTLAGIEYEAKLGPKRKR
jgi:hypothetical protein